MASHPATTERKETMVAYSTILRGTADLWDDVLDGGRRIEALDDVAPGDVVFLSTDRGLLFAFRVSGVARRDGLTELYMAGSMRRYVLGGASILRFHHAVRTDGGAE